MRDVTELPPLKAERRMTYGDDPNQFFDLWKAKDPVATVLFLHGGFWRAKYDLGHASFLCKALAEDGFTAVNVEYRRVGNSGGGWPGSFQDVRAAYAAIVKELAPSKLIVCGHSAGGQLALRLAAEDASLTGAVTLAPVSVLRMAHKLHLSNDAVVEYMGGTPEEVPKRYDDACPSLHPLLVPGMVIHGCEDDVVPVTMSREFLRVRVGNRVGFVELEQTGHMELIDPEEKAFDSLRTALLQLV